MNSEIVDDKTEPDPQAESAAEPKAGHLTAVDAVIVNPLLQKAFLVAIVVALLVFVLKQRRRSAAILNEKSLA